MEVNVGNNNGGSAGGGVGFVGLLQLLFIGLKLGKVIKWSWFWVLAPLWMSFGLVIIILSIAFIILKTKKRKW